MKKLLKKIRNLFPSLLPRNAEALDLFCKDLFETYDLPDMPGYRQAIGTMIMHLGPTTALKSKTYFALAVYKAQANEVAYDQVLKARKAADEAQKSEAAVVELQSVKQ
jgi:hypothetical protein